MTISPGSPLSGLTVKSAPATSAGTIAWTTIPMPASRASSSGSVRRYEIALRVSTLLQHARTAAKSSSSVRTPSTVSWSPAALDAS